MNDFKTRKPPRHALLPMLKKPLASMALLLSLATAPAKPIMAQQTIYFGTYTGPQSQGIYRSTLDEATGQLATPQLVAQAKNPSFLALSPNGRFLYAALEADGSAVGAWAIGQDGKLSALNQQPSGGDGACHVWVDASGQNVLVANYSSGSIACFRVRGDGSLGERSAFVQFTGTGPDAGRQQGPHAHSIYSSQDNTLVYACDLGTDQVHIFRFDAGKGTLSPSEPPAGQVPPGAGPRHLALSRGFAYANNEMGLSVTAFKVDAASGALTPIQTIPTVPADSPRAGVSTAEIFAHPNGKWLYVSNRGRDTIAVYAIAQDGTLSQVEEVATPKEPRGFALSANGKWLVVGGQKDNRVQSFAIDAATGRLKASGQAVEVGAPVCVLFAAKAAEAK